MSHSAEQFKVMGNDCMKNQDFTTAVVHYSNGLKLDPNNPILNCNMAQAHLQLKDYVEAEKYAKNAIEHQKSYTKAYYRAAKAAYGRHDIYDSLLYLVRGVQNSAEENIGDLYLMAKDLSPEFEKRLRTYRDETVKDRQNPASSEMEQTRKLDQPNGDKALDKASDSSQSLDISKSEQSKSKSGKVLKTGGEASNSSIASGSPSKQHKENSDKIKPSDAPNLQAKEKKEDLRKKAERTEKEKVEAEKQEREKKDRERKERERLERERLELEKQEREQKNRERKELEKLKQERLELEKKRKECERKEHQLLQALAEKETERKKQELLLMERKKELQKLEEERILALKTELQCLMEDGRLALMKGLNSSAAKKLEKACDIIQNNPPPEKLGLSDHVDLVILQLNFSHALILSGDYSDIVKAINILEKLEKEGRHTKFPAVFLMLGRAYLRLNRFKNAQVPFERGLSLLHRSASSSLYPWPGTNEVIAFTDVNFLKDAFEDGNKLCKQYHRPDAICFYKKCLGNSQHLVPSHNIFYSDPDFAGYVHIRCQENCHIHFHMPCWKEYKESLSEVQKFNEKDFLGRHCLTPDCKINKSKSKQSVITKVTIIGPDREEKTSCEYTPPPPSPISLNKESNTKNQNPKKKLRKKSTSKNVNTHSKRTRQDSQSHGDIQLQISSTQGNLNGTNFKEALTKLVTARENNFGYDTNAADISKLPSASSTQHAFGLGQNEAFVYSFFLEIFKTDGYMPILKLREYWEKNKEILPVLEPALITHTDLLKFLLDTNDFVVVQDMIGISGELTNMAAFVESQSEVTPQETGWQPSPATAFEASKTLSFTEFVPRAIGSGRDDVQINFKDEEPIEKHVTPHNSKGSPFNSSLHLNIASEICGNIEPSEPAEIRKREEEIPNKHADDRDASENPCLINFNPPEDPTLVDFKGISPINSLSPDAMQDSGLDPAKEITIKTKTVEAEDSIEWNENKFMTKDMQEGENGIYEPKGIQSQKDEDISQHINGISSFPKDVCTEQATIASSARQVPQLSHKKTEWKPRSKLMEWAVETFPGKSKLKLWQALTIVRSENNYTLSGLSYDVIAERVLAVLLRSGEDCDF